MRAFLSMAAAPAWPLVLSLAGSCAGNAVNVTADLCDQGGGPQASDSGVCGGPDEVGVDGRDTSLDVDAEGAGEGNLCKPGERRCAGKSVEQCAANGSAWQLAQRCSETQECEHGQCVCLASCNGQECGSDGCGGHCGDCAEGFYCRDIGDGGTCAPDCDVLCGGLECGDVGPGGECKCGSCDDAVACTEDVCEADLHCTHAPSDSACDDGVWCTVDTCDLAVGCVSLPDDVPCGDGNPCTEDACDPAVGCSYTNLYSICDDGNKCTDLDACIQAECSGVQIGCDDGIVCTLDSCDPGLGCTSQPTDDLCDDDLPCTDDVCSGFGCINSVQPFFCVVQGYCVPSGTENPIESCQKCLPLISQQGWSSAEDKTPCGPGRRCLAGSCCDYEASCQGRQCGDDKCGGLCGTCPGDQDACADGQCICIPKCGGATCGPDGCGGACGECGTVAVCGVDGACHCMEQSSCGDSCCQSGQVCFSGECCTKNCQGKQCGDNGCGSECGVCPEDTLCIGGTCLPGCVPGNILDCYSHCVDEAMWADGKCNTGGMFDVSFACDALGWDGGDCCKPACDGKICGDDGCGGDCGKCTAPEFCQTNTCYDFSCVDGNAVDWDSCTNGLVSEFQVNSTAEFDQRKPVVAALQDGGFLVVWEGFLPEGNGTDAIGRRFDSAGDATGDEFLVNEATSGGQRPVQVIPFATGGFGVLWYGAAAPVMIRPFDGGGSFAGGSFGLYGTLYVSGDDVRRVAAHLAGGKLLLVGRKEVGAKLHYQVFDANGSNPSAPFPIQASGDCEQADVASNDNGGAVVVWQDDAYVWGGKGEIYAQRFDPSGAKVGTSIQVNDWTEGPQEWPFVHGLKGGRLLVTWHGLGGSNDHSGTFLRVFEANGDPMGDEVLVRPGEFSRTVFSALPDGRHVAVWGPTFAFLDANGSGLTNDNPLTPADIFETFPEWPGVASFADSSFVAVWQSGKGQDGDGTGIFAQMFNPDGTVKPKQQ